MPDETAVIERPQTQENSSAPETIKSLPEKKGHGRLYRWIVGSGKSKSGPAKQVNNAVVYDEQHGKLLDYIDPDQHILGNKRRYHGRMVYVVMRSKSGTVTPLTPPMVPGEVLPEEAGDALEDPYSADIYMGPTSWLDVLKDFKLPIIAIVMLIAIVVLGVTLVTGGQTVPVPEIPGISG